MTVVVVGCSRRKADVPTAVPALDLYQGGCVPNLRARVAGQPDLRSRCFILSAEHGLLGADDPVTPYDRILTLERAIELRSAVGRAFLKRVVEPFAPPEVLVVVEPLYFVLIADILALSSRPLLRWEADPAQGWPRAAAVLDAWGWTSKEST